MTGFMPACAAVEWSSALFLLLTRSTTIHHHLSGATMSDYRPSKRVLEIAAKMYPPPPERTSITGPFPDPQMEADHRDWIKGGCVTEPITIIRPRGKPNLRLV